MNTQDADIVKGFQKLARGLRTTGITIAVLTLAASILSGVGEDWSDVLAWALLGVVGAKGLHLAFGAHAVIKEIDRTALDALLTPRRNAR